MCNCENIPFAPSAVTGGGPVLSASERAAAAAAYSSRHTQNESAYPSLLSQPGDALQAARREDLCHSLRARRLLLLGQDDPPRAAPRSRSRSPCTLAVIATPGSVMIAAPPSCSTLRKD
eukprot:6168228-Pleurochrysis_carterae.AAC.1